MLGQRRVAQRPTSPWRRGPASAAAEASRQRNRQQLSLTLAFCELSTDAECASIFDHSNKKAPCWGRLSTGCGGQLLTPSTADRVSVVHAWPALCLTGEEWDHVSGKRCSGLDLLRCDPGSGYAARGVNTREPELASRSLLLRDDVRAAPPSSLGCWTTTSITRTSVVRTGSGDPWPDSLEG